MNYNIIELLDLPNEMILSIMNKVKPQAILFCSIINIGNHRLEQLALDKCYSIDLSFDYYHSPYELLLKRFYSDVLPPIDDEILPNLRHLKILAGRRRHYTGTPFTISFHYNSELHYSPLFSTIPQSVYIEGKLIDPVLSIIRYSPLMRSINSFEFDRDAALLVSVNNEKLFFDQSYLTHISVTLRELSDCVRLLNQLGSQIYSFTASIVHVHRGDEDIIAQLDSIFCCNLKQLTMIIYRNILSYEEHVLPLLQHLSSVEHLTLLLAITVIGSDHFIDGYHLQRNIVSYMPHLRQFDFHIRSILQDAPYIEVDIIRQSFIEQQQQQQSIDCTLDYFENQYGQCQIYSLPFIGNRLDFISNRFPLFDVKNTFINVTILLLFDDVKSFENAFFECVTRALPRLRTL
ncbi:unnamed protein product [Rotaria sordida]|uniref:F-box domain-containing protein n=1 Tax=Rotaria sordida TaxID=392033 RepID=A0A814N2M5_9BILA|nr:unnamed protein product [Rotaria sordida]